MPDALPPPAELLAGCREFARAGGAIALRVFAGIRAGGSVGVTVKGDRTPVSEADQATQQTILAGIQQRFPGSSLVAEEDVLSGTWSAEHRLAWVVDPIDGTRNFIAGMPLWCVMVAALVEQTPVAGAIYLPSSDVMYSAALGHGAWRNDERLRTPSVELTRDSLMGCPSPHEGVMPAWALTWFIEHAGRNLGSAGLHLAAVAEGSFAAAAGPECKLWDVAAGYPLLKEAGAEITNLAGEPLFPLNLAAYTRGCVPWLAAGKQAHAKLIHDLGYAQHRR